MSNTALPHEAHVEISKITENIYVGTSMCCAQHSGYHQERLDELGIYADIDLRQEYDEPTSKVGAHLRLPVMDTYSPSPMQTKIGVDLIDSVVKDNKKVYIHCQFGHGRSPTLAAAYFILKEGMKAEEAVAMIMEARPEAHPTDRQLEFLGQLESSSNQ